MSTLDLGAKYQVLEAVGKDQTGTLYKARQILLDRVVAVKVVNPTFLATTEKASLLVRDVRLAAELNHPNIVRVHDIDKTTDNGKETIFIVTEFISGLTLAQYLEKHQKPPLSETLRIGGELCQGLAFAHKAGLSHQNINPNKILLSGGRQVKISDFGLASGISSSAKGKDSPLIGKPGFLAPEQINKLPDSALTPAVDIYAVGVLLYTMAAGIPPFAGPTPMDILTKQFKGTITNPSQLNPTIPKLLEQVILATLNKVPGERPPSAAHLFAYLDKVFRENCESKMVLESSGALRVSKKKAASTQTQAQPATVPVHEVKAQQTQQVRPQPRAQQPPTKPVHQQPAQQEQTQQVRPQPVQQQQTQQVRPQPAQQQPTQQVQAAPQKALQSPQAETKPISQEKATAHIDATLPPPQRRPFLRKVAYAGMAASFISMLIVVIFGLDVDFFTEKKEPEKRKDIQGLLIERPQKKMVQVSWMSKKPYVGQLVLAKKTQKAASAVTSRRVVVGSKPTREHRLVYDGLRAHEEYTVTLFNMETGEVLKEFEVSGRAKLVGGPYLFTRRGSADIDWISNVRLNDPRVLIRSDSGESTDPTPVKARQTQLEDKTYRYTATYVSHSPDPVFAEIAGIEDESCRSIKVVMEADILASTKPDARPMYSLATNRYILAGLKKSNARYAQNIQQMLPSWAQRELSKERRSNYSCFISGPIVAQDQLLVGDQAGTVYSYSLNGDEAFKAGGSAFDLSFAYFDPVGNYDSCTALAYDGTNVLAQMVRARPVPIDIRARDREVRDEFRKKAKGLLKSFLAGKELRKVDELVYINPKARQEDRAKRLKDYVFDELVAEETSNTLQGPWGERAAPTKISRFANTNEVKEEMARTMHWCMSSDKKTLAAVLYAEWQKPKGQYILRTKDLRNDSSSWVEGLDKLETVESAPVCHEDVVYTISLTRQAEDLSELDKPAPSFISAYDLKSKKSWRFSTTGTLQFTQLFFDDYRHRVYFCSHEKVYSLDHGLRTKMMRENEEIPDGMLTSSNEFEIPVKRIIGLLPPKERGFALGGRNSKMKRYLLGTPIIFAPRRWKSKRELIMLSLNSPPEADNALTRAIRRSHLGASLYMFDLSGVALTRYVPFVARGAQEDYGRIVSAMPPDALCHFIQQGVNGTCLYSLMGRTFVFDLNEEPTIDILSGMQRHILLDHAPLGKRFRRMFLHQSTVYYADMGGRLRRIAFSPTRIPRKQQRTPLPILQAQEEGEANSVRLRVTEDKRKARKEDSKRRPKRGQYIPEHEQEDVPDDYRRDYDERNNDSPD